MVSFFDKLRLSDSKGGKSWTMTLSVGTWAVGLLYVLAVAVVGIVNEDLIPLWLHEPFNYIFMTLIGSASLALTGRNWAIHSKGVSGAPLDPAEFVEMPVIPAGNEAAPDPIADTEDTSDF
jgi:phosphotransferase system  glucose/maltose/N-acetylglucosamine-specific IIC component